MIVPTELWGLPLSPMTRRETVETIMRLIEAGRPSFFITANTNYAMLTAERPGLRAVNEKAAFVVADGSPMIWASRRGPVPLPERVTGSDLIYDLAEMAAEQGRSVYFLGGGPGVADEVAAKLSSLNPGLKVVGTACPTKAEMSGEGVSEVIARVRAAAPDLLLVALSQPTGEMWLAEHCEALGVPACAQFGAAFDFVAGRVRRAPRFFQKIGMEWAYRIYTDPTRLAPRYFKNARFLFSQVAKELVRGRAPRPTVDARSAAGVSAE